MPNLTITDLKLLKDDYTNYHSFIETGTNNGETIFDMDNYFDKLYTIEFSEKYYENTKNKYDGNKIKFLLGDSSVIFEELLPTIKEKSIFFLDAHWCGADTGRSNKDCPLIEEIISINKFFMNEAIIIIDDYRLFGLDKSSGMLGEDWRDISKDKILDILKNRINDVYHIDSISAVNDRLIIHINKI